MLHGFENVKMPKAAQQYKIVGSDPPDSLLNLTLRTHTESDRTLRIFGMRLATVKDKTWPSNAEKLDSGNGSLEIKVMQALLATELKAATILAQVILG